MIRIITAALFTLISFSGLASESKTSVALARGEAITPQVFHIIYQSIKKQNFSASPAIVINRLAENRLLAIYSEENDITESQSKVGFQRTTSVNDQLVGLLRSTFRQPYSQWQMQQPDGLHSFIIEQNLPNASELKALMGNSAFVYELSGSILDSLKNTTLVRYSFPRAKEQVITLRDIYQRQNVQGRISLHQGDTRFLQKQVLQMIDRRSVLYWAQRHSGLSPEELASLKQIFADQRQRKVVMQSVGLGDFYHGTNPVFDELVKQVNQEEILAFYSRNKSQFQTIEAATIVDIRLSSQKEADEAYIELNTLSPAQQLARFQQSGQKPKIVSRTSSHPMWLTGLAFAQEEGQVSKPARLPVQKGESPSWAIVLVLNKEQGFLKPDSETVRYEASRNIAQRKANENFQKLITDLREQDSVL